MSDLAAQAVELVERTCSEQGLPVVVTDDRILDRVAGIVRSASSAPSPDPRTADGGASSAESEPTSPREPARPLTPGRVGAVPSEKRAS